MAVGHLQEALDLLDRVRHHLLFHQARIPLVPGNGPQSSHLNPDAPRVIQRWNGHQWEPHCFAANLAEAKRILYPQASEAPGSVPAPERKPLDIGTGKHRKPQDRAAADSGGRLG